MSDRNRNIDAVAGLLILNMVVFHYSQIEAQKYLGFFIPWFFYKSGLFYKELPIKESFVKTRKLLIPLVVFSILGHIIHSIKIFLDGDRNVIHYTLTPLKEFVVGGALEGNLPLWFITSLLIVKFFYNYLNVNNITGIFTLTLPIVIILHFVRLDSPIIVSNVINGMFFYSFGEIIKDRQNDRRLVFTAIIVTFVIALFAIPRGSVLGNEIFEGYYILWLLYSLFGCITIDTIFRFIPFRLMILPFIGRQSLVILVTHWFFIDLVNIFISKFPSIIISDSTRTIILYSIFILGEIFLIRLFGNRKLQWVVGH